MTEPSQPTQYKISLKYDRVRERDKSNYTPLSTQLEKIPKDAKSLVICEDVPTDDEWEEMGEYFSAVEYLDVEAGVLERLNDCLMPLHWPLKRLIMDSSGAEVVETEHILEGRVQHLVLYLTCGIRFEGPTTDELIEVHRQAIERGEKDEYAVTNSGVKITSVPALVGEWMHNEYGDRDIDLTVTTSEPINLTHLEILENDAVDAFIRFTLALPCITNNLRTLNIRSTNGCDLHMTDGSTFPHLLKPLSQMETLVLSMGESWVDDAVVYEDNKGEEDSAAEEGQEQKTRPGLLISLYESFPPNLRTLRLRLPTLLTENPAWEDWIRAFSSPDYLPHLSTLSVACDIACNGRGRFHQKRTRIDDQRCDAAKAQVKRLVDAVRARGGGKKELKVEPFVEKWSSRSRHMDDVDERWSGDWIN